LLVQLKPGRLRCSRPCIIGLIYIRSFTVWIQLDGGNLLALGKYFRGFIFIHSPDISRNLIDFLASIGKSPFYDQWHNQSTIVLEVQLIKSSLTVKDVFFLIVQLIIEFLVACFICRLNSETVPFIIEIQK